VRKRLVAGVAVWLSLSACQVEQVPLGQGAPAPAFEGVSFDGTRVSFPELVDGKPTVLVLWATW